MLVVYHRGCFDGFCAAWVLRKKYPDAEFVTANYGETPPDVKGRNVIVADFSYPRATLEQMRKDSTSLVVLDHHKTAEEELKGLNYCIFDMEKSGGRLAWEFVNGVAPSSWLVDYTEDRDLWNHKLKETKEINAWLRSHPMDFELWNHFASEGENKAFWALYVTEGEAILRREKQQIDAKVSQSHLVDLHVPYEKQYTLRVVNSTTLISETAGELAKETGVGCCWFEMADGQRCYSLRSVKGGGVDVSKIAKRYGGGGHVNAAGFKAKNHPWFATDD